MGLPCMQCRESFSPRHTFESAVYDEGVFFFCSKKCMDMWMSVNAQEIELEDQQQPST
jgi:ribosomal protein L24E